MLGKIGNIGWIGRLVKVVGVRMWVLCVGNNKYSCVIFYFCVFFIYVGCCVYVVFICVCFDVVECLLCNLR